MDSNSEDTTSRAPARPYTAARFTLELDGQPVGFIKSVEGGGIRADVINEQAGPDFFVHKHIGQPNYEEVTVTTDLSLEPAFYAMISDAWGGKTKRRDVTVFTLDEKNKIQRQAQYFNALISEVGFPASDAASKDPAYMTVKFAPEYTRYTKASGKISSLSSIPKQKKWLCSNFRLTLGDLPCKRVSKVDAITVKQAVVRDPVGEQRDYTIAAGRLEFPNLTITLAEIDSQAWQDWFDDFVVRGNNGEGNEINGALTFLSPDLKTTQAQIDFFNVGIFKLTPDKVEAGSENIRRVKVEVYVERMAFAYPKPVS